MASTIPAVKAALIALWAAQLPNTVVNGPVVGVGQDAALTVGFQDPLLQPVAVDGALIYIGFGKFPPREQYTVNCALAATSGTTDVASGEAALFALWDQVIAVLSANFPTLGVAAVKAVTLDRFQYIPSQAADGFTGTILFGVAIDADTS